jgi:hypothetical protein
LFHLNYLLPGKIRQTSPAGLIPAGDADLFASSLPSSDLIGA